MDPQIASLYNVTSVVCHQCHHDQFLRELSTEATHRDTQNLNFVRRRSLQTVAELGDLRDTLVR